MLLTAAAIGCLLFMTAESVTQIASRSEVAPRGVLDNEGQGGIILHSDLNGIFIRQRRKRAAGIAASAVMLGHRVVKKLLSDATKAKQLGHITIYRKPGGYSQAYADFKSVKLNGIKTNGVQKWGFSGDTTVTLEAGIGGSPTTMLLQRVPTDHAAKVYLIIYRGKD